MNESEPASEQLARISRREWLLAQLFPGLKRGNEPDMPMTTHDRLWFLRESRFLFFTRGGPVEVTLRPSYVLATVIVGMVGIATIFYTTMIASYSAIEVIHDETIQTAEASIGEAHSYKAGDLLTENWTPSTADPSKNAVALDHSSQINGKTAIETKPLVSLLTSRPNVRAPQSTNIAGDSNPAEGPIIIQGGKRIFPEAARETTRAVSDANTQDVAQTATQESVFQSTNVQSLTTNPADVQTSIQQTEGKPRVITRARDLTLAMLPSLLQGNTPPANQKASKNMAFNTPRPPLTDAPMPDNSQFGNSQNLPENDTALDQMTDQMDKQASIGPKPPQPIPHRANSWPTLPLVSEAARARKLELSARDEINFIRTTVTELGVAVAGLPRVAGLDRATNYDDAFKDLMISLAEHRATLRKIPFKSPMHHFYVTSPYGKRKHPKTGKYTFHHGVDLAGTWQENVRSTAPGTIIFAGVEGHLARLSGSSMIMILSPRMPTLPESPSNGVIMLAKIA